MTATVPVRAAMATRYAHSVANLVNATAAPLRCSPDQGTVRDLTPISIAVGSYAIRTHARMLASIRRTLWSIQAAKSQCTQGLGCMLWSIHSSLQQPGVQRRLKCPSGHARARMRALAVRCVGCVDPDSEWSPKGACALSTIGGGNRRCCKGLEPSRRLSETTGPQSPSTFRIAFRRQR